jgi:TolB-like protein/Tfp pilus assembly protein PilF
MNVETANYTLDLGDERLWNGDKPVQISNKAFQLLRLFVHNPNRLLTKDHILEGVWRDVCVSEGLIKEYVHDLRQALGDDPRHPRFIETVHGRGYRFLGGVEESQPAVGATAPSKPRTHPPSLVVLPFTNLTGEERWARFCRGLSDDLIIDLARYPDFMVIANGALSAQPTDGLDVCNIGRELAAGYVLNGSVQASSSKVRVNAKLIETGNGNHLWTDQYERELGEVFAIQSDIIAHVASAVGGFGGQIPHVERLRLGRKPPGDLQAYELYLLGHELESRFEKDSTLRAFELARRAVELDPDYARAWLVLAWTCWQIKLEKWADDSRSYWELEREAFIKAATLDPLDPFAILELAAVRASDGDITGARDALERALDLGRNQAELLIVAANSITMVLDEPARALQVLDKGLEYIAIASGWQQISMARVAYFAGDFERALKDARRAPANLLTRLVEILSLAQLDRAEEARDLARVFESSHPNFDPREFAKSYPITAAGAKRLFLEGAEKAGLG